MTSPRESAEDAIAKQRPRPKPADQLELRCRIPASRLSRMPPEAGFLVAVARSLATATVGYDSQLRYAADRWRTDSPRRAQA